MADAVAKVRKALGMGRAEVLSAAALGKRTRAQLLEAARALGVAGLGRLQKGPLTQRLLAALERPAPAAAPEKAPARARKPTPARAARPAAAARSAPKAAPPGKAPARPKASPRAGAGSKARPPARATPGAVAAAGQAPAESGPEQEPAAVAKLDLGPAAQAGQRPVAHIPWGYGADRISAAAIDPDRLFVYWELTDPAIERARSRLGQGGPTAWPSLRVYDTSGRIFDGTNALSYSDHRVERSDRRWFLEVGRPGSTAVVEIGLQSSEGYFVRLARSGRVDFPRKDPAPWAEPEWMTVLPGGEVHPGGTGTPLRAMAAGPGPVPLPQPAAPPAAQVAPHPLAAIPLWVLRQPAPPPEEVVAVLLEGRTERVEWREEAAQGWVELQGSVEWVGPHTVTSWRSGPLSSPIEIEPPQAEAWQGRSFAYKVGEVTHVVHGPWQVVIRNLAAQSERAELGRWQVFRSWVATAGREVRAVEVRTPAPPAGASEARAGASERRWLEGSELRLGGASEQRFAGASQWMERGASERRLQGASEQRLGGASDQAGGSEGRLGTPPGGPGAYPKAGG